MAKKVNRIVPGARPSLSTAQAESPFASYLARARSALGEPLKRLKGLLRSSTAPVAVPPPKAVPKPGPRSAAQAAGPGATRHQTEAKPRPGVIAKTPQRPQRVVPPRVAGAGPAGPSATRPQTPVELGVSKAADIFFNADNEALVCIDPTGGSQPPRGKGARLSVQRGRVRIDRPGGLAVVLPALDAGTMTRLRQARFVIVAESTGKTIVAEYPARFA